MQHAALMSVMHGARDLDHHADDRTLRVPRRARRGRRRGGLACLVPAGEMRGEVAALHQAHGEKMRAVHEARLVQRDDVRMIQLRGCGDLRLEPQPRLGRRQVAGLNHLQRHDAVQADLPRAINHPHAASRQLGENLVVAEEAGAQPARNRGLVGRRGGVRLVAHRHAKKAMRTA